MENDAHGLRVTGHMQCSALIIMHRGSYQRCKVYRRVLVKLLLDASTSDESRDRRPNYRYDCIALILQWAQTCRTPCSHAARKLCAASFSPNPLKHKVEVHASAAYLLPLLLSTRDATSIQFIYHIPPYYTSQSRRMSSSRPRRSTQATVSGPRAPTSAASNRRSRPSRGSKVEPEVDEDAEGEDDDEEEEPAAGPSRKSRAPSRPSIRGRTKTEEREQDDAEGDVGKARRNRKSVSYREVPVEEADEEDEEDGDLTDNPDVEDDGEADEAGMSLRVSHDI